MFEHFILCRYNVGLYSTNPYGVKDPDKWMEERIPMFKRLIESLRAQTNKKFIFVVFIDDKTPDKYRDELIHLSMHPFGVSIVKHSGGDLLTVGKEYLGRYRTNKEWVITSRIDNDDAYLPDFVDSIQKAFAAKEEILDVRGYQEQGGKKYSTGRTKCNSPFISLVEKKEGAQTVFSGFHDSLFKKYPARMASENPMYIQYIHDNNISNTSTGVPYDESGSKGQI